MGDLPMLKLLLRQTDTDVGLGVLLWKWCIDVDRQPFSDAQSVQSVAKIPVLVVEFDNVVWGRLLATVLYPNRCLGKGKTN